MELWDGYDADGNKLNIDLVRGEPIPDGTYHLVAEVLVRHTDGSYLVTQRALDKHQYGGYWEASAGGSVLKGETALEAAARELFEETGIRANNLELLDTLVGEHAIFVTYLCLTGWSKKGIALQENETIDYFWLSHSELLDFMETPDFAPPVRKRILPLLSKLGE